jgi:colanic acid/amylovoran biosynthesis protein
MSNPTSTPKKVLITNTMAYNGGDAAILIALIETLKEAFGPDTGIVIYDSNAAGARLYYPEFAFRQLLYTRFGASCRNRYLRFIMRRLGRLRFRLALFCRTHRYLRQLAVILLTKDEFIDLKHYESADLVIATGGTYLVEKYSLEPRLFDFQVTLQLGRPLVFFTQSLGPFHQPAYRRQFRQIFSRAKLVLVRDELSRQHIHEIAGNCCPVRISADGVFTFADRLTLEQARRKQWPPSSPLRVAISVRDWPAIPELNAAMPDFRRSIIAAITHLTTSHDAEITMISTCQGIPEYRQNDAEVASSIVAELPDNIRRQVRQEKNFHPPQKLAEKLSRFDLVIATRMHMAILALTAGVPVLPIAYEFKTRELFSRLGLTEIVLESTSITPAAMVATIEQFFQIFPAKQDLFFQNVVREKELAEEVVKYLRSLPGN